MVSLSAVRGAIRFAPSYSMVRRGFWKELSELRRQHPDCWPWAYASRRIHGWLSRMEAAALFQLAKHDTPSTGAVIVELGSWKGKSSVMLAGALVGKQSPRLYCVDLFAPSDGDPSYETHYKPTFESDPVPLEEQFRRNMVALGLQKIVMPIRGYTGEVAKTWTLPVHMLFVDANHEYEAATRDFESWSPFLVPGGIIAFHDINEWPGPTRVFNERVIGRLSMTSTK